MPSPVPASQESEKDRWQNWLGQPSSAVSSYVAVEGSRVSLEHRVSPGVSDSHRPAQNQTQVSPITEGRAPNHAKEYGVNQHQNPNKLLSSCDSSEMLGRYEEIVSRLRQLEQCGPLDVPQTGPELDDSEPSSDVDNCEEDILQSTAETRRVERGASSEVGKRVPEDPSDEPSPQTVLPAIPSRQTASEATDPVGAWKTFVFGDENSDEIGETVFKEARHDAARRMHPSDSSTGPESKVAESNSNIATVGTMHGNDHQGASEVTETPPPTEVSVKATYDSSSAYPKSSEPADDETDTSARAPSVEVNAGTSSGSGIESSIGSLDHDNTTSADSADTSTSRSREWPPSLTTSMAVVPARSDVGASEAGVTGEQFRFVPPKPFVGSRSSMPNPRRQSGGRAGISLTRRRGRPRRRANDGRADIRALPNYSSDPIEEVEEQKRVPKSIFPALELS
ncbi:hypothetical protein VTK26DRAFT_8917 [Humicola hyalothermophila]